MLHTRLSVATETDGLRPRAALSITAPEEPIPVSIVFAIDRSGSTSSDATPGLPEGERDGVTILDLTVNSIKVGIKSLRKDDRVAVVKFDERATIVYPMSPMTDANKRTVLGRLDSINSDGGTQIWSGIRLSLETMLSDLVDITDNGARSRSILVFTDGIDITKPLRGNIYELSKWIDANQEASARFSMHTVGFGAELDSKELHQMAGMLGGRFSHIPEATTAGTILVNFMATELSTFGTNLRVTTTKTDGTVVTSRLGAIRAGQTRTVPVSDPQGVASIEVSFLRGAAASVAVDMAAQIDDASVLACLVKFDLVETLRHVVETCESSSMAWALPYCAQQFAQFRARNENFSVPFVQACVADVKDQLHKAVENEKWHRAWGLHYMRSYMDATEHEVVSNFRDKAVQLYGSTPFKAIQARCEAVFLAEPPIPKKKPVTTRTSAASSTASTRALASYQARYYDVDNRGSGCFCPESLIQMLDGSVKPVGTLRKGDMVACTGGLGAAVRCLVWSSGTFTMVSVGGFTLTPTHPVLDPDAMLREWVFPKDLPSASAAPDSSRVVNLVLDSNHEIIGASGAGGVSGALVCCTLGHGFREPVVEHSFLGTEKVIDALKEVPGFEEGSVEVTFTRSSGGPSAFIDGVKGRL
jgi:hypothetical protein